MEFHLFYGIILLELHVVLLSVDFSYCWINLVEAWYSLEQYIGL